MPPKAPLSAEEADRIRALAQAVASGNLYRTLNVSRRATKAEIERTYREFVVWGHPDRFFSRDSGELKQVIEDNFVAVTRAFKTLSDEHRRAAYEAEFVKQGGKLPEPDETTPPAHEVSFQRGGPRPAMKAAEPPPPPPPLKRVNPVVEKMKQQVAAQLSKARGYFDAGKEDYDAGRYGKAEASLYLAMKCDPNNSEYAALYKDASARARSARIATHLQQAEQAEQYGSYRDAILHLQKVVEADPPDGLPWFKLATLVQKQDGDDRAALQHLRKAVQKEPHNLEFRLALGDVYVGLGMGANAVREAQAALAIDARSAAAKALNTKAKALK